MLQGWVALLAGAFVLGLVIGRWWLVPVPFALALLAVAAAGVANALGDGCTLCSDSSFTTGATLLLVVGAVPAAAFTAIGVVVRVLLRARGPEPV